jgi:hypothetical protein
VVRLLSPFEARVIRLTGCPSFKRQDHPRVLFNRQKGPLYRVCTIISWLFELTGSVCKEQPIDADIGHDHLAAPPVTSSYVQFVPREDNTVPAPWLDRKPGFCVARQTERVLLLERDYRCVRWETCQDRDRRNFRRSRTKHEHELVALV